MSSELNNDRAGGPQRPRPTSLSMTQTSDSNREIQLGVQDPAILSQFTGPEMLSHNIFHPHPYGPSTSLQGHPSLEFPGNLNHGSLGNNILSPLPFMDFPWDQHPTGQDQYTLLQRTISDLAMSQFNTSYEQSSSTSGASGLQPPYIAGGTFLPQGSSMHSLVASSSASSPDPEDQTGAERIGIAEEKRRRNTAASAKFRIKKKQRTINLERSVSDLTGRAEDLEREAADLRRENGWLKEIVMLKSGRIAHANLAAHMAESGQSVSTEPQARILHKSDETNKDSDDPPSSEDEGKGTSSRKSEKKKTKRK